MGDSMRHHHRMVATTFLAVGIALFVGAWPSHSLSAEGALARNDGLALTPPMGWNSWYYFRCAIDELIVEKTADAMSAAGLRNIGYQYVIVDDCWQGGRDSNGVLFSDPKRFPH